MTQAAACKTSAPVAFLVGLCAAALALFALAALITGVSALVSGQGVMEAAGVAGRWVGAMVLPALLLMTFLPRKG
jgi:hypothetical protein